MGTLTTALGSFVYRMRSTGTSSATLGPCEVCKLHCSEVFIFTEMRGFNNPETGMMGYTYHGAQSQIFGHRECVLAKQKEVIVANAFENTKAALKVYDEGKAEREARWHVSLSNAQVDAAEKADMDAIERVQLAFHRDTMPANSVDNCKLLGINDIRHMAGLDPEPGSINIGRVGFGQLTGESSADGLPKWKYTPIIGGEREKLLTDVYKGLPLPKDLILIGQNPSGGFRPIQTDHVAWNTSRIPNN